MRGNGRARDREEPALPSTYDERKAGPVLCSSGDTKEKAMVTAAQLNDSFDSLSKTVLRVRDERNLLAKELKLVLAGFEEDPGTSDLDDEQPISVSITLGDYRRIRRELYAIA
jgi:hypothetical protein